MAPKKKRASHGYKIAETLPANTILQDILKKRWLLGPTIGKGGFGQIYSARPADSPESQDYSNAVKIEPHSNGPLFVEINFYVRYAKSQNVEAFLKSRRIKSLGIPLYHASGSHFYNEEKYRFLVIDKFSSDLSTLYKENNSIFPTDTVFKIAIQLVDVLEYIHSCGYIHGDIKPANILLGKANESDNKQVYLADYGLACKYTLEQVFKPNPKRAHDGTLDYLSRDGHHGVPTRRGDLEILAYNLFQWLGCRLPWEGCKTALEVQNLKAEYMTPSSKIIKACFDKKNPPKAIVDYLFYLSTLGFSFEPDYDEIREIFTSGVEESGGRIGTPLKFSVGQNLSTKRGRTPLSVNRSNNKEVQGTPDHLDERSSSDDDTPKQKAMIQKSEKEIHIDDPKDDFNVTPKLQIGGRTKSAKDNVPKKDLYVVLKKRALTPTANLESKPETSGRKQAAVKDEIEVPSRKKIVFTPHPKKQITTKDEKDKSDLISKLGTRRRKQTTTNDDENKNANKDDKHKNAHEDDEAMEVSENEYDSDSIPKRRRKLPRAANKNVCMSEQGRKQTGIEDDEDETDKDSTDLVPKMRNRAKKQTAFEDVKDKKNIMSKPGKRGRKKSTKEKQDDSTPKRLTTKGIRNLEVDLKQDNDSSPFEGYTAAMKELQMKKMKKEKTAQKYPRTKETPSCSTDPHEDDMSGYTSEMREIALKKLAKAKAAKKK